MMLNGKGDPAVVYGDAFLRHITNILNLCISFPQEDLYLFDDDVKETFRHSNYHPDVVGYFSFLTANYLIISIG